VALHLKRRIHSFLKVCKKYYPEKNCEFELFIVYDKDIELFKKALNSLLKSETEVKIKLRFKEYKTLKKEFGIE
jgi:hypothetical protein